MIDPHRLISKYCEGYTIFRVQQVQDWVGYTEIDHKVFYFCVPHMDELNETEQKYVVLHEITHALRGVGGHDVKFYEVLRKICRKEKVPVSAIRSAEPYCYPDWFPKKGL